MLEKTKIIDVLNAMDATDNALWTVDGSPKMDYLQHHLEDDTITRKIVTEAYPTFNREMLQVGVTASESDKNDEKHKLDQKINENRIESDTLQKEQDVLQAKRKALQIEQIKDSSATSDTIARMAFIKSQTAQRKKRVAAAKELYAATGGASTDFRAPVDRAFARKTQRGTQRPT